ncbi:5-oxoproline transporter, DUF979 family subunit [Pseudoalteromonas distincta]|nr:DUF979 family protein [Pseudoalteromonas distincta]
MLESTRPRFKNRYHVIKVQIPTAVILLAVNIILMYSLVFND